LKKYITHFVVKAIGSFTIKVIGTAQLFLDVISQRRSHRINFPSELFLALHHLQKKISDFINEILNCFVYIEVACIWLFKGLFSVFFLLLTSLVNQM
jgi:hypothetical protein